MRQFTSEIGMDLREDSEILGHNLSGVVGAGILQGALFEIKVARGCWQAPEFQVEQESTRLCSMLGLWGLGSYFFGVAKCA
ncbi:MAG: hypothetical protein AB1733_23820 [Thermodesulfobacteriota bacterium]